MENGKAALARNLAHGVGRGSTEFFVLRPGDRVLDEYIYHFVRQARFREEAKRNFTGTAGQQRVPKPFMENALIPLPPLDEQRRIVDILNRAVKIDRLRAQARERLREFIPALFIKMFGDERQILKMYPCRPLREVSEIASGATKGRKIVAEDSVYVPYLRVANVQDGYLDLGEMKTITIRRGEEGKYALTAGDLVMTEGGDVDKLCRAAVWNGELDYCAHQNHVFRVRPTRTIVSTDYLRDVAGSEYGKSYFLSVAKRTTGIASINKTQLGGFPVPLPPIELQMRYERLVNRVRRLFSQSKVTASGVSTPSGSALADALMSRLLGNVA